MNHVPTLNENVDAGPPRLSVIAILTVCAVEGTPVNFTTPVVALTVTHGADASAANV
nr:hypothetical protein [Budvicia aquatica]